MADLLAESLSLEKVGWVFTSTDHDSFISPNDMKKIAEMQEKFSVDHPEGFKVSKFVTVIIKRKIFLCLTIISKWRWGTRE